MGDPSIQGDLFAPHPKPTLKPPRRTRPEDPLLRRRTFAVGRSGPRTREVQFVEARRAPLAGPWALKAVVSGS